MSKNASTLSTLSLHFCLRGSEIQAQLKKKDIVFKSVDDEAEIVPIPMDLMSKNHQGGLTSPEFQTAGSIADPNQVSVLKKYLGILDALHRMG